MSVEINSKDLTNPKSFLKKFFLGLLSGAGGVGQQMVNQALMPMIPNAKPEVVSAIQWIIGGLAAGANNNQYIEKAIDGFSAGAAKDLVTQLANRFGMSKLGINMPNAASINLKTSESPINQPYSGKEYFI